MPDYKLRFSYKYEPRFGANYHTWICIGGQGALHLHISGPHHYEDRDNWSAGLEIHRRQPWPSSLHDAPTHDECWVLKGPCWQDGTTQYAMEHFLPRWQLAQNDHEQMFGMLGVEYKRQFVETADA